MAQGPHFQYTHVEASLVENVVLRPTEDTETYPSGWKYTLHLGTLTDLTLVRYDNAHEGDEGARTPHCWKRYRRHRIPRNGGVARGVLGERGRVLGRCRWRSATALLTAHRSSLRLQPPPQRKYDHALHHRR